MTIARNQLLTILLLLGLVVVLPLIMFVASRRQDIRPRALQGKANLLLSSDATANVNLGDEIHVLMSIQLTEAALRVSGSDLTLLYDKNMLDVVSMTPSVTQNNPSAAFTDVLHISSGDNFDTTYNFLRISLVARKGNADLSGGTVSFANVTFRAKANGSASVKFPTDPQYTQVVGISL